jgi:hypothetical protein
MDAEHPLLAMDGGVVHLRVYGEIQHLTGGERGLHPGLAMAGQAGLVGRLLGQDPIGRCHDPSEEHNS